MTVHVAIDIETASTRQDAAILSVGWAQFADGRITATGYRAIQAWDTYGGHIDAETLAWWALQDLTPRLAAFVPDPEIVAPFSSVLAAIPKGDLYWGDPPSFDLGIIDAQAQRMGLQAPWTHRNQRCARTYRDGRPKEHEPLIAHHPEDDAIALARNLIAWGLK